MKKIIKIGLILLIAICITGSVYAVSSCNISIKIAKSEYSKGDSFTVDVNISDIKSDRGIISFGGTLEYDKDSLTLEKIEGLNGWETPSEGSSYNESNGKFAITRNGVSKKNETILRLEFKVKNTSKKNLTITLKNMTLADGTAPIKVNTISKKITIKDGTINQKPSSDSNQNSTSSKNDSTVSNKKIPQTGENNFIILVVLGVAVLVTIIFLVRMKRVNRK